MLNRESMYRMLSEQGNPQFATLAAILRELGLKLSVQVKDPVAAWPSLCHSSARLTVGREPCSYSVSLSCLSSVLRERRGPPRPLRAVVIASLLDDYRPISCCSKVNPSLRAIRR